jgi:hypothetical protein
MKRSFLQLTLPVFAAAVLIAGCSGGSSTLPSTSGAPSSGSSSAKGFNGTVTHTFAISTLAAFHERNESVEFVSILQLAVNGGNASFAPYGHDRDCSFEHSNGAGNNGWNDGFSDGPIYSPSGNVSFAIPGFTMPDPCQSQAPDAGNYYVLEVSLPDLDVSAIAGPGSNTNATLTFPPANAALSMNANGMYAFVLVRTTGTLPTPAPPTPAPACPNNTTIASPPPSLKSTPAPATTAAPSGFFTFYSQPNPATALACDPQTRQIYGTSTTPGFFAFNPSTGTATYLSAGTSFGSSTIAAGGNGNLYLDPGPIKGPELIESSPDGSQQSQISLGSIASLEALVTGSDGNVYAAAVGGEPTIFQVTPSGTVTPFAEPAPCTLVTAAAADAHGNLYFADAGCGILKMTTGGAFTVLDPAAIADSIATLAVGPDGAVYYGSQSVGGIVRVDATSGVATPFPMPAAANSVLAIVPGADGNLWFSADNLSGGAHSGGVIARLDLTTGAVAMWPTTIAGTNDPGGTGQTAPLHLVAGPGGDFYGATNSGEFNLVKIDPSVTGR